MTNKLLHFAVLVLIKIYLFQYVVYKILAAGLDFCSVIVIRIDFRVRLNSTTFLWLGLCYIFSILKRIGQKNGLCKLF